MKVRGNIAIDEKKALKLSARTGLHPMMTGVRDLYTEQKVGVVHGVGYPNPNLSHFRSTDIWMTASASNQVVSTGWMGRYLHKDYPNYPEGYPNETMPDPIAIQMSAIVSLALTGQDQHSLGVALQNPETFYQLVSGTTSGGGDLPKEKNARDNVQYVRGIQSKSMSYSSVIKAAADKANNIVEYPTGNRLADQLKIVARLIAGGLKTRVYVVTLGGFDTHANQAGRLHPFLHPLSERVQVHVAGVALVPHAADTDLRLIHVLFGHASTVEHRLGGALAFRLRNPAAELIERLAHHETFGLRRWCVRERVVAERVVAALWLNERYAADFGTKFDFRLQSLRWAGPTRLAPANEAQASFSSCGKTFVRNSQPPAINMPIAEIHRQMSHRSPGLIRASVRR